MLHWSWHHVDQLSILCSLANSWVECCINHMKVNVVCRGIDGARSVSLSCQAVRCEQMEPRWWSHFTSSNTLNCTSPPTRPGEVANQSASPDGHKLKPPEDTGSNSYALYIERLAVTTCRVYNTKVYVVHSGKCSLIMCLHICRLLKCNVVY